MTTPSVEYGLLSPALIVFAVAVAGVLVEAFLPRRARYPAQLTLSLTGLLAAFGAVVGVYRSLGDGPGRLAAVGAVTVDRPALFLQGVILLVSVLGVLLIAERHDGLGSGASALDAFTPQASAVPGSVAEKLAVRVGVAQTEVFPLTMFAVGGMLLFPAAGDLLTAFIALEVLSLPLYLMCGLARHRRLLSQEAALKYFLLGAFSSAFFLYGMALLYGYAGTLSLTGIAAALRTGSQNSTLALIGASLVAVGLLFKVSAVPFHAWVPDVYQGAPTPVTAFMAATTKIAAFGALLRLLTVAVPELKDQWRPVLWAVAIATLALGTLTAIAQKDVKRMLAYSAVAHTGFLLIGVIAASRAGVSGTLFYLAAYGFTTLGAFAFVSMVRDRDGREQTDLAHWAGLGRRYPVAGVVFSLLLLSFAGIPLTSGFISKFAVFTAAAAGGAIPLVVIGVLASAIAVYFYVRVIMLMFFTDPPADAPDVLPPGSMTLVTIALSLAITFVLGTFPQPVLDLADSAATFLGS
ncbi:MAG: NADH-quinone oxidoreductase subunit NuoN [Mycobacteriaceae bacterium]